MSTTWNLTREQIATKALRKVGALAANETPQDVDLVLVYDELDSILKELPIHGYAWPRTVSGQAALTLTLNDQTTNLPADYYGGAMITYPDASGNEIELPLVTLVRWNQIKQKTLTGVYPQLGFIDHFNVLWTYPIQTATLNAKLVYEQVIDDTVAATQTSLKAAWMYGLIRGVAACIGDDFGVDEVKINRWQQIWVARRELNIMADTYPMDNRMTVDDGCYEHPRSF